MIQNSSRLPESEKGSSLIVIIWILIILGMIATFLFYRSEIELASLALFDQNYRYRHLAEGALQERLVSLKEDATIEHDTPNDPWFHHGFLSYQKEGYRIDILIEDEGSKPNVNLFNEAKLGVNAFTFPLAPLYDWIDFDDEPRENGAERDYYQSLKTPYQPRNSFLIALDELPLLKNGAALHQNLGPFVTVHGKINPNTITAVGFGGILKVAGLEAFEIERLTRDFEKAIKTNKKKKERFQNSNDLLGKINSLSLGTLESIKPYLTFQGNSNLNLVNQTSLEIILKNLGFSAGNTALIMERRQEMPFISKEVMLFFLKTIFKKFENPEDYFSLVSRIIRYRIWISNQKEKLYYLDTVWQRTPLEDSLAAKWRVEPLAWKAFRKKDIPELANYSENTQQ